MASRRVRGDDRRVADVIELRRACRVWRRNVQGVLVVIAALAVTQALVCWTEVGDEHDRESFDRVTVLTGSLFGLGVVAASALGYCVYAWNRRLALAARELGLGPAAWYHPLGPTAWYALAVDPGRHARFPGRWPVVPLVVAVPPAILAVGALDTSSEHFRDWETGWLDVGFAAQGVTDVLVAVACAVGVVTVDRIGRRHDAGVVWHLAVRGGVPAPPWRMRVDGVVPTTSATLTSVAFVGCALVAVAFTVVSLVPLVRGSLAGTTMPDIAVLVLYGLLATWACRAVWKHQLISDRERQGVGARHFWLADVVGARPWPTLYRLAFATKLLGCVLLQAALCVFPRQVPDAPPAGPVRAAVGSVICVASGTLLAVGCALSVRVVAHATARHREQAPTSPSADPRVSAERRSTETLGRAQTLGPGRGRNGAGTGTG